jgi:hypothetical protein
MACCLASRAAFLSAAALSFKSFLVSTLTDLSGGSCFYNSSVLRLSSDGASSLPLLESPSPHYSNLLLVLNSFITAPNMSFPLGMGLPCSLASNIFLNIGKFLSSSAMNLFWKARMTRQQSLPRDASISDVKCIPLVSPMSMPANELSIV